MARGLLARALSTPASLASGLEHFPSGGRALLALQLGSADAQLAKSNKLFLLLNYSSELLPQIFSLVFRSRSHIFNVPILNKNYSE
jgi:hypothetical protein